VEVPGGIYHVGARGNRGCELYADDAERRIFLRLLSTAVARHGWTCHAYCLMTNHYHLLVQLESVGLSAGVKLLNGGFARFSNRRHGNDRQHLFRNRFWSEFIESESHLLETARYIVLNPVRGGHCDRPERSTWSSYRACAGFDHPPRFLGAKEHLALFARSPAAARRAYRQFVRDGLGVTRPGDRHRDESRTRETPP